jgi:hypothetical protein
LHFQPVQAFIGVEFDGAGIQDFCKKAGYASTRLFVTE